MKTFYAIALFLISFSSIAISQTLFRSGMFLHHSTGACIWGPNDSNTSIPDEIDNYNAAHGYTGDDEVYMGEEGFPLNPWDNEWKRWHDIFDGTDATASIEPFYDSEKIIVIKSCFPSSGIESWGSPSDTLDPDYKSVYNYKWHWRNFINVMKNHPDNFFAVWTNAPLVPNATNDAQAQLSDKFCRWAKDSLALGLDPVFGDFPPNVYVFDFFHKLAGADGKLQLQYAQDEWDSHPNAAATELVAPQFVEEIFDAAIAYEDFLPVELISFTAQVYHEFVELKWKTATETNNRGFEIERRDYDAQNSEWKSLGFVKGRGTASGIKEYSFTDKTVRKSKFKYRLKQIDFDGTVNYSNAIEVDFSIPLKFKLFQNYPNPFGKASFAGNNLTEIKFYLPEKCNAKLTIYNVLGEEVFRLINQSLETGMHTVSFNASSLKTGIYFYELQTPRFAETKKMLLIQ